MCRFCRPASKSSGEYALAVSRAAKSTTQPQSPEEVCAALFDPATEEVLDFTEVTVHGVAVPSGDCACVGYALPMPEKDLEGSQESLGAFACGFDRPKLAFDKGRGLLLVTAHQGDRAVNNFGSCRAGGRRGLASKLRVSPLIDPHGIPLQVVTRSALGCQLEPIYM